MSRYRKLPDSDSPVSSDEARDEDIRALFAEFYDTAILYANVHHSTQGQVRAALEDSKAKFSTALDALSASLLDARERVGLLEKERDEAIRVKEAESQNANYLFRQLTALRERAEKAERENRVLEHKLRIDMRVHLRIADVVAKARKVATPDTPLARALATLDGFDTTSSSSRAPSSEETHAK